MIRRSHPGEGERRMHLRSSHVVAALLIWLAVAIAVGASGAPAELRPPVPQLVLIGLTILLVLAGVLIVPFRRRLASVDLRWVVACT
jgi:hypothetical protein